MLHEIKAQAIKATEELVALANLKKGDIFVVGCSSSEVGGNKIGTNSSEDTGKALFDGIYSVLKEKKSFLLRSVASILTEALL